MNIRTYDTIKYIIDNKYIVIQNSNIVNVRLINPIIIFEQIKCGKTVTIKIKNNSGTNIKNLIYFECRNDKDYHKDIIIPLNCLNNDESIIFKLERKDKCQNAFIKYDLLIGKQKNTIYIKCCNHCQIVTI